MNTTTNRSRQRLLPGRARERVALWAGTVVIFLAALGSSAPATAQARLELELDSLEAEVRTPGPAGSAGQLVQPCEGDCVLDLSPGPVAIAFVGRLRGARALNLDLVDGAEAHVRVRSRRWVRWLGAALAVAGLGLMLGSQPWQFSERCDAFCIIPKWVEPFLFGLGAVHFAVGTGLIFVRDEAELLGDSR